MRVRSIAGSQFVADRRVVLAWAGSAQAAIPASLKTSCADADAARRLPYKFCDDGLPPSGGTTPNHGGTAAVEVPAKYDGL